MIRDKYNQINQDRSNRPEYKTLEVGAEGTYSTFGSQADQNPFEAKMKKLAERRARQALRER